MVKLILFALIGLLLIGGGGGGAYWWFYMQPPPDPAAEAAAKAAEPQPPPIFANLKPVVVPVIRQDKVEALVTVIASVQIASADDASRLVLLQPRLTDAMIVELTGALSKRSAMKDGRVDAAVIKHHVALAARRVAGEETIKDVLVQIVNQQNF
ncbi:MAG TPA: hypothetical protein VEH84_02110 [Alphaproteobacteria bacterium]|nr:hypothetical protein [Alphaproteobacteria bacterium]